MKKKENKGPCLQAALQIYMLANNFPQEESRGRR